MKRGILVSDLTLWWRMWSKSLVNKEEGITRPPSILTDRRSQEVVEKFRGMELKEIVSNRVTVTSIKHSCPKYFKRRLLYTYYGSTMKYNNEGLNIIKGLV